MSLALGCLCYPFFQRQALGAWLTTLNQLALFGNIPWDFDLSELAAKMSSLLRYPTRRKSSSGNLEEATQFHADSSVCHLERACLELPDTIVSTVVFFEQSHPLPCCKALVLLTFPWLLRMLGCFWHLRANIDFATQILTARKKEFRYFLFFMY